MAGAGLLGRRGSLFDRSFSGELGLGGEGAAPARRGAGAADERDVGAQGDAARLVELHVFVATRNHIYISVNGNTEQATMIQIGGAVQV